MFYLKGMHFTVCFFRRFACKEVSGAKTFNINITIKIINYLNIDKEIINFVYLKYFFQLLSI